MENQTQRLSFQEVSFQEEYDKAKKNGFSIDQMLEAVGNKIKETIERLEYCGLDMSDRGHIDDKIIFEARYLIHCRAMRLKFLEIYMNELKGKNDD